MKTTIKAACVAALAVLACAGCSVTPAKSAKPILICNEDNDLFFYRADNWHTDAGIRAYFDTIAKGGAMTHYFMCVNGQRTSYASKVWEPIWLGANDLRSDGKTTNDLWCTNARKVHERGLDPWAIWIECARQKGISPWISMRMNDTHFSHIPHVFRNERRFYERTDLWCGPNCRAWDYSKAEVREHAMALVLEILERWDADGLELDWLRFPRHLPIGREHEGAHYITDFMRDVRKAANRAAARRGHCVKIAARVPTHFDAAMDALGLDAITWVREGLVDMIIPCNFYTSTDFGFDARRWVDEVRKVNPDVLVVPGFSDMARSCRDNPKVSMFPVDKDKAFVRAWASLYGSVGDGIYIFNAFYHPKDFNDWFLSGGLSPARLNDGSKRYITTYHDISANAVAANSQLPRKLNERQTITIRAAPCRANDAVRVVLGFDVPAKELSVALNGVAGIAEPNAACKTAFYPKGVCATAVWRVPAAALREGENRVMLTPKQGETARVVWSEIRID